MLEFLIANERDRVSRDLIPHQRGYYAKIPASLQQIDQELLQQVQGGS